MKYVITGLLIIILHVSLACTSHAQTLAEQLTSFAHENRSVLIIESPFLIQNSADLTTKLSKKFSSESEVLSNMRKLGYDGAKNGNVITLQFNGQAETKGLYVFSLSEYDYEFSKLSAMLRAFDTEVSRNSKYSEDLIDSFSDSQKPLLSTGMPVSSFSPMQAQKLNKWAFGLRFSKVKEKIYGASLLSHAMIANPSEISISLNEGIINIGYTENGKQRMFQLGSDIGKSDTSNIQLFPAEIEPVTLSRVVSKISSVYGVNASVHDSIKHHELVVVGNLEGKNGESILAALAKAGKWQLINNKSKTSFFIRPYNVSTPKNVSEIDTLCRRVVKDYPISAIYGADYVKRLRLIVAERDASMRNGTLDERAVNAKTNEILKSNVKFKHYLFKYLVSRLSSYKRQDLKISQLSGIDKRLILALCAVDIYGMVGPNSDLVAPDWMQHLQEGVLFASFKNDGKYDRVNVELVLQYNGKRFVPLSVSDALYHPNFER